MKKLFFVLAILWLVPRLVSAQLSGNYTIGPAQTYTSIAAIINDLNLHGVSGAVSISVPANYVETTPIGGFSLGSSVLNASLSSTNTLQFIKSGSGNNPLIYGAAGQYASTIIGALCDNIWSFSGVNYVTIDGIDLCDSTSNTSTTTANEAGFAFYKLNSTAPFDGCQYNKIVNCTIRMQNFAVNGGSTISSVGILFWNKTRAGGTIGFASSLNINNVADANSYNKLYRNTIVGGNFGIAIGGLNNSNYAYWDKSNDIGGYSSLDGNHIYNFGCNNVSIGISVAYGESNINISNNVIDNTLPGSPSMGSSYTGNIRGIVMSSYSGTVSGVTPGNIFRCVNNRVNIGLATLATAGSNLLGIASDYVVDGILIDSNHITLTSNFPDYSSNDWHGIFFSSLYSTAKAVISHNIIDGSVLIKHNFYGIYDFSSSYKNKAIVYNKISTNVNAATNLVYYGIRSSSGVLANRFDVSHNSIYNISNKVNNLIDFHGVDIASQGFKSLHFDSNYIGNIKSGRIVGLYLSHSRLDTLGIFGNVIEELEGNEICGITEYNITSSSTRIIVDHNLIQNLKCVNSYSFNIGFQRKSTSGYFYFSNNIIKNLKDTLPFSQIAEISGLSFDGFSYDTSRLSLIYNNVISVGNNLSGINDDSNMPSILNAIYFNVGRNKKVQIFNNTLSVFGNLQNRQIVSAVIRNKGTDTLVLQNNIFNNYSVADVTYPQGVIADIMIDNSLNLLGQSSNNNSYYLAALHKSSNAALFYSNSITYDSLSLLQNLLAPRESASFIEESPFISLASAQSGFCNFNPAIMTRCESNASANTPIVLTADQAGNPRYGTLNYSGVGTAQDIGAYEVNCAAYINPIQVVSAQCSAPSNDCAAISRTITCSLAVANNFTVNTVYLRYQWNGVVQAPILMSAGPNNTWTGILPAASPSSALVSYYIEAQSNNGNICRSSVATLRDASFSSSNFQIMGAGQFGCGNSLANLSVSNLGDTTQIIPSGYGVSMSRLDDISDILNITLVGDDKTMNNTSTYTSTGGPASNGLIASVVGKYANYSNLTPVVTLSAGKTYPFSFTVAQQPSNGLFYGSFVVYIDLNRNGFFDLPLECVYTRPYAQITNGLIDSATYNVSMAIPTTTVLSGRTLMRCIFTTSNVYSPATVYMYGETEDYVVNLSASASTLFNYAWTDNGTSIGTNSNVLNYTATQAGNHIMQVVISNGTSCQVSDTAHILVNNLANISLTPNSVASLCNKDSVVLSVQYSGATPILSWLRNGNAIPNASGLQYTVHQGGNYSVWYNNGVCVGTTNQVQVQYYPSPASPYSALVVPSDSICRGEAVQLNVTGLTSLNWSPNYTAGSWITPQASTNYSFTGLDANACYFADTLSVYVDSIPHNLSVVGNPNISIGTTFNYVLVGASGFNYQWVVNGGNIVNGQGSNSISVLWSSAGSYGLSVIIHSAGGCVDTVSFLLNFIGINSIGNKLLSLYPNPASDYVIFDLSSPKGAMQPYRVENVLGQLVLSGQYLGRETRIDLSTLVDGVYYLKVDHYSMPFVVGQRP